MTLQDKNSKILLISALILIGIFSRLLPHPPNFTAIAAVALFAGAHFRNRILALALPMVAMFVSDLIIGLHSTLVPVYIAFIITVGIGILISENKNPVNIIAGALSGSVLFFIITNFATWMVGTMYEKSLSGLLLCYTAAIPFFQNTLAGDLFFTGLLFGSYFFVEKRLQTEKIK